MRKSIIGAVATFALTTSTLFAPAAVSAPAEIGPGDLIGAPAAVAPSATPRLAQWQELQFGLFMHWGIYSSFAGSYKGKVQGIGYPEQIKAWMNISDQAYLEEAAKMDAPQWDAGAICQMAKDTGMKYVMITSKHHDGFAMWDTKTTDYNIVKKTAFGRDPMKELQTECNKRDIKLAFYFSIIDWTKHEAEPYSNLNRIDESMMPYIHEQINELMTNYGPIAEFWFDMGKPTDEQSRLMAQWVHDAQPDTVVNSRVWNNRGDFEVGGDNSVSSAFAYGPWESIKSIFPACWGYCSDHRATRAPGLEKGKARSAVNDLVTVISGGGQFAYNIGPKGDGSIDKFDADTLKIIGDWMKRHPDAITGAKATYFPIQKDMRVTTKGNSLFFFPSSWEEGKTLTLPGLANRVTKVTIDGTDTELPFERNGFDLNVTLKGASAPDEVKSVIRVDLDGPAAMYVDKTVTLVNGLGDIPANKAVGLFGANTWGNPTAMDFYIVDKGEETYKEVSLDFKFNQRPNPRTKYKITFADTSFIVTGSELMAGPVGQGLSLKPKTVTRVRVELAEPAYYTNSLDFTVASLNVQASVEPGVAIAPVITEQPSDQEVVKGASATFAVTAVGRPAPTFQWYKKAPGQDEAVAIDKATESTFTVDETSMEDNGTLFSVKVTNDAGSVTSKEATLRVVKGNKNLALNKRASQSSTGWGGNASRAVDGNTDGFWDHNSVTHTMENARGSWWQVELDAAYPIGLVNVWNRAAENTCRPTCDQRLHDFYVIVSQNELNNYVNIEQVKMQPDAKVIKVEGVGKHPSTVNFEGFKGKWVRVFLPDSKPLSLAEVEVNEYERPEVAPDVSAIEIRSLLDNFTMAGDGQFRTVTADAGTSLVLSAEVTGDPEPAVQWQTRPNGDSEWVNIDEATSNMTNVEVTEESDGSQYRLMATNTAGVTYSGVIELQVNKPTPPDGAQSEPGDGAQSVPGDGAQSVPGDGAQSVPGDGAQSEPGDGAQSVPGDGAQSVPGDGAQSEPSDNGSASPQSEPKIRIIEGDTAVGGKLVIEASGFKAGTEVTFMIHSEPTLMGKVIADAAGKARLEWTIPANFEVGKHKIYASAGDIQIMIPIDIAGAKPGATPAPGAHKPGALQPGSDKGTANAANSSKGGNTSGGGLARTGAALGTLAVMSVLCLAGATTIRTVRRRR